MPAFALAPHQLRLTIDPATLGFASTAELQDLPLPWIGQERAQAAAQFGLAMQQPDYHLFLLGEVGSGRASLLRQAMQAGEVRRRPVARSVCRPPPKVGQARAHRRQVPQRVSRRRARPSPTGPLANCPS